MNIVETKLDGVCIIEPKVFEDERGQFIKVFNQALFEQEGLPFTPAESYYSISKKNVIRGMHFQIPPADHIKLVYVTEGAILDVVLDLRKGSPTYGEYITLELTDQNRAMAYIPSGFAHGFLSLQDNTRVTYLQSTGYSPEHDSGIRMDSFGMKWGVSEPIWSKRDREFPLFTGFQTPFMYRKKP